MIFKGRFWVGILWVILLLFFIVRASFFADLTLLAQTGENKIDKKKNIDRCLEKAWENIEKNPAYSLKLGDSALKSAIELEDKFLEAQALNLLGSVCFKEANYPKALNYFLQSLKIKEQIGELQTIGSTVLNIGVVYEALGNIPQAFKYYSKAEKIFIQYNDTLNLASVYSNLGNLYSIQDSAQQALMYHQKALKLREAIKDLHGVSVSLVNIAEVYITLKNYRAVVENAQKALKNFKALGNLEGQAVAILNLGAAYLHTGQLHLAEHYLLEGLHLARQLGSRQQILEIYKDLSLVYELENNYARALEYYKRFAALKDTLFSEEKHKAIAEIQAQYDFEKKERQIELLNKDKKISELIAAVISILLVLVLTLALNFYFRFLSKKRANALLTEQKEQLQRQKEQLQRSEQEKSMLLRELHHRVKNNLQVLSSMLSLQSSQLTDPVALAALEQGRFRVEAISLIHQGLYKDETNVSKVQIREYITNLFQNLMLAHGFSQRLQFVTDIEDLVLEVETAIPLGLILNELLINTFKYAFRDSSIQPKISLTFKHLGDALYLAVQDNGVGLPENFDIEKSNSFGFKLVKMLCRQLKADIHISSESGTKVEIFIRKYKIAQDL
ncbi:MAG: tetratricopeptide repeat protein [Bacteroidia bacterium]|nr:tetratricopeptide repeat protein [Bacteroidia bacterium]MDW8157584.1 tetratricopeptide repeat protein [Bacteroidia bacterium]